MSLFRPDEIDLKVGLEIHQQLDTPTKLFCRCKKFEDTFTNTMYRTLRPTQSELGKIDQAARFEFEKDLTIKYEIGNDSSCLVETDDEPPHQISMAAVKTSLLIALSLNSNPVDELQVMRKIVIDGSNTAGFQRTLIISIGGELKTGNRSVPVQSIFLEEDAARLLGESENKKNYGLDRLGVPLIEIALAPVTATPKEIQDIAYALGRLMRSTRLVSRGLGTIRQDINISILGGKVVEVKGVQRLDLLEKVIIFETLRQKSLIHLKDKLENRGLTAKDFQDKPIDVSSLFQKNSENILNKTLKKDMKIYGIRLKGFSGILSFEDFPGTRFGRELADVARFYGLGGLLHSDEIPGYGVTHIEMEKVRSKLHLDKSDGFLLISGDTRRLKKASVAIQQRIQSAFKGVPAETRGPTPDGKTRFIRPRPGAARMYPETDIPPIIISAKLVRELKRKIPRPWEEQISDIISKYSLSRKLAIQIYDSPFIEIFEELSNIIRIPTSLIAATLTETVVNLSRAGLDTSVLTVDIVKSLFMALDKGIVSKEAIPQILELILKGDVKDIESAVKKLGLSTLTDETLLTLIKKIINENKVLIDEKGTAAFSNLMGQVMSDARGRADGQKVSNLLKSELNKKSY
jgi:glutamyl-tRNA(Gln) amidotransferase subunit E